MRNSSDDLRQGGIIAKSLAEVGEVVDIAWPEDEAAPELQRVVELETIFVKAVLAVSSSLGALACCCVVTAKKMEYVRLSQVECAVRQEGVIHEQGKFDATVSPKRTSVLHSAESDGDHARPASLDLRFMIAQLRDVLAAEDSAPVAEKNCYGRLLDP